MRFPGGTTLPEALAEVGGIGFVGVDVHGKGCMESPAGCRETL